MKYYWLLQVFVKSIKKINAGSVQFTYNIGKFNYTNQVYTGIRTCDV